jgi:low affinity Fe/Cu permease
VREQFARIASRVADAVGSQWAFIIAASTVVVWAISGPLFGFSDTWQLVINTGTTIVTFLMVFLIQNTQNRDTTAMQLKLDELLRAVNGAREGEFIDLERMDEKQVQRLHDELVRRAGLDEPSEEPGRHRQAGASVDGGESGQAPVQGR